MATMRNQSRENKTLALKAQGRRAEKAQKALVVG
jgi:hypothetical protein